MLIRFVSAALVLSLAVSPALPADAGKPAITGQTQPMSKLLADLKMMARLVAGDEAVKSIDDGIKENLGEKGFTGLDLNRHFLGYGDLDENVEKSGGVLLVPYTTEDDFKDFLGRIGKGTNEVKLVPVEKNKGLFKFTSKKEKQEGDPDIHARFANGYCYFAINVPVEKFTAESLIAPKDLLVGSDTGLLTYRMHFDRMPPGLKKKGFEMIDQAVASITDNERAPEVSRKAAKIFAGFVKRTGDQILTQGDMAGYRLVLDQAKSDIAIEAWLAGKKGTDLAKAIAERKPSTNQFAGLLSKEAAAGVTLQLPLFAPEIRELAVIALEEGDKALAATQPDAPELVKELFSEPFKGLARTVKTGEFDIGAAVIGPDKDGHFNFAAGMSYVDTSKLEKLLRDFIRIMPEKQRKHIVVDAGKAGDVAIHEIKPDILPPRPDGKELPPGSAYVAFAPKAIYVTFGPTGMQAMKDVLAAKPAPARAFDVVVNPKRFQKLVATFDKNAGDQMAKLLGTEDEALSTFYVEVLSGEELRIRIGGNLKVLPKMIGGAVGTRAEATFQPVPPPPVRKQ